MKKIIGNWKCNQSFEEVLAFFKVFEEFNYAKEKLNVIVAVPDVWLFVAKLYAKNITIAAQDASNLSFGSFTGIISYEHLKDIGIKTAIIGHSETRKLKHFDNLHIHKQLQACLSHQIETVLCIGESLEVYENNEVVQYLVRQLDDACRNLTSEQLKSLTIAYEPIWAIGSNKTPSEGEIETIINVIKQYMSVNFDFTPMVLYGGSVNESNIESLSRIKNLDGFLIGSASLNPHTFSNLIKKTGWNLI